MVFEPRIMHLEGFCLIARLMNEMFDFFIFPFFYSNKLEEIVGKNITFVAQSCPMGLYTRLFISLLEKSGIRRLSKNMVCMLMTD